MQTKVNAHLQKRARLGWRASALTCSDPLQYMGNKHSAFVVFTPGNTATAQVLWQNHKKTNRDTRSEAYVPTLYT